MFTQKEKSTPNANKRKKVVVRLWLFYVKTFSDLINIRIGNNKTIVLHQLMN